MADESIRKRNSDLSEKTFVNALHASYETFWNFVSFVIKHDYRDDNSKILNQFKNTYRRFKTFIANTLSEKLIYSIKNNLKHTINVKNYLTKYCGILI